MKKTEMIKISYQDVLNWYVHRKTLELAYEYRHTCEV